MRFITLILIVIRFLIGIFKRGQPELFRRLLQQGSTDATKETDDSSDEEFSDALPAYDSNIRITHEDLMTLSSSMWLNDNVINTYLEMIGKRSRRLNNGRFPTVYAFSTFFYPKFLKEGYSYSLQRWTQKIDIFSFDLLIFPIHLGIHWGLAVADFRKKTLRYYDSLLLAQHTKCVRELCTYLSLEMKRKKNGSLERSEWKLENMRGRIPIQENESDCGVFCCKFAEYLSRDAYFNFSQENMDFFRQQIRFELIHEQLFAPY